jgi:hypothetical protein
MGILLFCTINDQEQAYYFIRNVLQKELKTENYILFNDTHRIGQM